MITQLSLIKRGDHALRMPQEKVRAYLASMPWLKAWLDAERERDKQFHSEPDRLEIRQIYVQGIDASFLDYAPVSCIRREHTVEGSRIYFTDIKDPKFQVETIYFLDGEGKVVEYEVEYEYPKARRWLLFMARKAAERGMWRAVARGSIYENDMPCTINIALCRLGERRSEIQYAVSYCAYTKALIAYRPPRSTRLVEHLYGLRKEYVATLEDAVSRELGLEGVGVSVSSR